MGRKLDIRIKKFFTFSVFSVLLVCTIVFSWAIVYMQKQTESSVEDISNIYMEEVSFQIQQKFASIIDLRLDQVEGAIRRSEQEAVDTWEDLIQDLRFSAEVRDFTYRVWGSAADYRKATGYLRL